MLPLLLSLFLAIAPVTPEPLRAGRWARTGMVSIADPTLAVLTADLERRSPTFAAATRALAEGSVPVVVGTPEQLRRMLPRSMAFRQAPWLPVSYARAIPGDGGRVRAVVVVIDVPFYERLYRGAGMNGALAQDLQILLAHELAGHALGWARDRRLAGGCRDPEPLALMAAPELAGCAVEQENRVRDELGVLPRPTYLNMVYPSGQAHDEVEMAYAQRPR